MESQSNTNGSNSKRNNYHWSFLDQKIFCEKLVIETMKFISITIIICITLLGLFGTFAIFTKQGNRKANKLLGFFFLLWAFDFLDGLLLLEGFYLEHPNFALWNESFVFLYGPLLYFYTLHIARKKIPFKWRFLLHLIPFIISFTTIMIFLSYSS